MKSDKEIMEVKLEICMQIEKDAFQELKKVEHHAEYLLDLDHWPEIKSVYGCKVKEIK